MAKIPTTCCRLGPKANLNKSKNGTGRTMRGKRGYSWRRWMLLSLRRRISNNRAWPARCGTRGAVARRPVGSAEPRPCPRITSAPGQRQLRPFFAAPAPFQGSVREKAIPSRRMNKWFLMGRLCAAVAEYPPLGNSNRGIRESFQLLELAAERLKGKKSRSFERFTGLHACD